MINHKCRAKETVIGNDSLSAWILHDLSNYFGCRSLIPDIDRRPRCKIGFFWLKLDVHSHYINMFMYVTCNLFTHGAPRSLQELVQKCPCIPGIGIWKCWFLKRGKNRSTRRKTPQQSREPTTNSTHICRRVRRSNPGYIGGRQHSHHCTIPAPQSLC